MQYAVSTFRQSFIRTYGIDWGDRRQVMTARELQKFISNDIYLSLLDEIEMQRAFTLSYIASLFENELSKESIRSRLEILVRRKLLFKTKYVGKAKSSFGVGVYYTGDASQEDIDDALYSYRIDDELRYEKEMQRKKAAKKKMSPEEIAEFHKKVKIQNEIKRMEAEHQIKRVREWKRRMNAKWTCCNHYFEKKYEIERHLRMVHSLRLSLQAAMEYGDVPLREVTDEEREAAAQEASRLGIAVA